MISHILSATGESDAARDINLSITWDKKSAGRASIRTRRPFHDKGL